jgi:DNA-binding NarL/FixJ family response regulator
MIERRNSGPPGGGWRDPWRRSTGTSEKRALTGREREILNLLAEGIGTEGIRRQLAISRVTVRNHVQRILRKLGTHSRLEALAHARREGLLHEKSGD